MWKKTHQILDFSKYCFNCLHTCRSALLKILEIEMFVADVTSESYRKPAFRTELGALELLTFFVSLLCHIISGGLS